MSDPKLKMIEIYGGKNEQWKGWHNLVLDVSDKAGDSKSVQGPIDPETSAQIIKALSILKG